MNLIAAYGNMRSSVAEWPCSSPRMPASWYIRCPAWNAPLHVPIKQAIVSNSEAGYRGLQHTSIFDEFGIRRLEKYLHSV